MTEDDALDWLAAADVPPETSARLTCLVECVREENDRQNLIAPSTLDRIWSRHVVDSLQLVGHAPPAGAWIDIGSGAGFPGLVVAAARDDAITLVEPRRLRAEFLVRAAAKMGIGDRVRVIAGKIEAADPVDTCAVVSARAVAPLDRLFAMAYPMTRPDTLWLLPKGRGAAEELEAARRTWQGAFRLEPSITDPEAAIVVASRIAPRKRR